MAVWLCGKLLKSGDVLDTHYIVTVVARSLHYVIQFVFSTLITPFCVLPLVWDTGTPSASCLKFILHYHDYVLSS